MWEAFEQSSLYLARPIRLDAFLEAWSFQVHAKAVFSLVLNVWEGSFSAKPF